MKYLEVNILYHFTLLAILLFNLFEYFPGARNFSTMTTGCTLYIQVNYLFQYYSVVHPAIRVLTLLLSSNISWEGRHNPFFAHRLEGMTILSPLKDRVSEHDLFSG